MISGLKYLLSYRSIAIQNVSLDGGLVTLWAGWTDGIKNPPLGRVLVLAFAVVKADHMFGLGKEEPAGCDNTCDMGDYGQ